MQGNEFEHPKQEPRAEVVRQKTWTYRRVAKELSSGTITGKYLSPGGTLISPTAVRTEFGVDKRVAQSAIWDLVRTGDVSVEKSEGNLIVTPVPADKRPAVAEVSSSVEYPNDKRIAFALLNKILSGAEEYEAGDLIPRREVLAIEYGVEVKTIGRAIGWLGDIVISNKRAGTRVANPLPEEAKLATLTDKIKPPDPDDDPPLNSNTLDLLFTDGNQNRSNVYTLYLMILNGELPPGEIIPVDLDWSKFPTGKPAYLVLSLAMTILRNLGLVDRRDGILRVVTPPPSDTYMNALGTALAPEIEFRTANKPPDTERKARKERNEPHFHPRRSEIIDLATPPGPGLHISNEESRWTIAARERGDTPLEEITTHLRRPPAFIANLLGIYITDEVNEIRTRRFVQTTSTPDDIRTYLHNVDYYFIPVDWLSELKYTSPNDPNNPLIKIEEMADDRQYRHQTIQWNVNSRLAEMFGIPDNKSLLVHILTFSQKGKPFAVRMFTQPRDRGAVQLFVREEDKK